ncbi:hypothetical protein HK097_007897, partial [Rhizophlyctis rosea]
MEGVMSRMSTPRGNENDTASFSFRLRIPKEASIPESRQPGWMSILMTRNAMMVERWLKEHFYNELEDGSLQGVKRNIAFCDCEWVKIGDVDGLAVLQIGVPGDDFEKDDFRVLLIQMARMTIIPSTLTRLMKDRRICKAFHGFAHDLGALDQLGIKPRSAFEVNALSRVYLRKICQFTQYSRLPTLPDLVLQYLNIIRDTATFEWTQWDHETLHPWKARYAGLDTWYLWALVRNLDIRIKGEEDTEAIAEEQMRKEIGARIMELELGGIEAVNNEMHN